MIIGKAITAGGSGGNIKRLPLPEGYTQLTYIQSTGTQYIDTGYVPNQNTRIILDAHVVPTTSIDPVFGSRTATNKNAFGLWLTAPDAVNPQYGNVSYGTQTINMDFDRRLIYELNKNVFTVDRITRTFAEATFSSTYPMYLFQINNFGEVFSRFTKGKIYSCKIYDNDVLVRDFVPCRNPDNVVGLYEMVNGVFYGNAGSGVFSGAPLSNVSGVSCFLTVETSEGAVVTATLGEKVVEAVADENGFAILILNKEGIWTVTATYDGETVSKEVDTSLSVTANVKFAVPIGEFLEGQSIWLKIDGVEKEFIIINQGIPSNSADYDETADGTWVLAKDIYTNALWNTAGASTDLQTYENCTADTTLSNTMLPLFERQDIFKEVNLPITNWQYVYSSKFTHSNIARKIFLLSQQELGISASSYKEGGSCNYFTGNDVEAKRIAYDPSAGANAIWWTRSVWSGSVPQYTAYQNRKYAVNETGGIGYGDCNTKWGIRPALVIKSDTPIDGNGRVV